jgi:hypothetical protein
MAEPQISWQDVRFHKSSRLIFSKGPSNKNQYARYGSSMTTTTSLKRIHFLTSSWHLLQWRNKTVADFTTFRDLITELVQFYIALLFAMIRIAGLLLC